MAGKTFFVETLCVLGLICLFVPAPVESQMAADWVTGGENLPHIVDPSEKYGFHMINEGSRQRKCPHCPPGYIMKDPGCGSNSKCHLCNKGTPSTKQLYSPPSNKLQHFCKRCEECFHHQLELKPCTFDADRVCKPCNVGPCPSDQIEIQACTQNQTRICACRQPDHRLVNRKCIRVPTCNYDGPNVEDSDDKDRGECAKVLNIALKTANFSANGFSHLEKKLTQAKRRTPPGPNRREKFLKNLGTVDGNGESSFTYLFGLIRDDPEFATLKDIMEAIREMDRERRREHASGR